MPLHDPSLVESKVARRTTGPSKSVLSFSALALASAMIVSVYGCMLFGRIYFSLLTLNVIWPDFAWEVA